MLGSLERCATPSGGSLPTPPTIRTPLTACA
jgi:hypothetical protein